MQWKEIKKTIAGNRRWIGMLEYYDATGKAPTRKLARCFTISQMDLDKLKAESARTGRSMSALLDEMITKM